MLKAIVNLFDKMESHVKFKGFTFGWFPVLQGTRQGAFRKLPSIYVFSYFPFGLQGRMWDLIVSVPDHCLSFYFLSPFLYLVSINDLILELKASMEGLIIYNIILGSPAVVSSVKAGLTIMMQICHRYSLKWQLWYQTGKCSVVVYSESEKQFRKCKGKWQWFLGTGMVEEATEYKHLGVILVKHVTGCKCWRVLLKTVKQHF